MRDDTVILLFDRLRAVRGWAAAIAAVALLAACATEPLHDPAIRYPHVATVDAPARWGEVDGVSLRGGFGSALALDPRAPGYFYLLTDRGPNADGVDPQKKVFPAPEFTPRIGRFKLEGDRLRLVGTIELKNAQGRKLTGLPNPGASNTGETAVDLHDRPLGTDPDGLDSEGLVALSDGSFWISDEYGPWLVHVDANGTTLARVGPFGGAKSLPRVLALRRPNRGMEALTVTPDERLLVGLMQGPLDNPGPSVRKLARLNRLVVYDPSTGATRQYAYIMESVESSVSDIAAITATSFIVLERDPYFPGDSKRPARQKRIYRIDIAGATDLSDPADGRNGLLLAGKTPEQMTDAELRSANVVPVAKELLVDLLAIPGGYPHDKAEGLAIINDALIAVSNDDDFGIMADGKGGVARKTLPAEGNRPDVSRVYFIRLDKPLR